MNIRAALAVMVLTAAAWAQVGTGINNGGGGAGSVGPGTTGYLTKFTAATTIGNSACDDGITTASTITCTEPIVISSSTAGYSECTQGSTNGVGAVNTIRDECPTAVTAYTTKKPVAAPTNNNSAVVYSNASPAIGAFAKMPQTAITSGSAYTNATTTFSSVVGSSGQTLAFSVEASTNYIMHCEILWQGSAATTGPKFQFTGPASPTAVAASLFSPVTTTTFIEASAVAFSSAMADTGTVTTATNFIAKVTLGLVNGTTAGTVTLQAAANGVGTLTIQPGSFCVMQ